MPKLGLNRQQLASFLKNQESIVAFEQLFDFSVATPTTIEEAAALAGTAAAIANQALGMLAGYAELLEQMSTAPAQSASPEPDNFTPAIAPQTFGSLSEQDAAAVAITGGAIDGTTIGATNKASGAFTTLSATTVTASDQISATKTYTVAPAVKATTTAVNIASSLAATNSDASQFLVGYSGSSADPTQAIWWNAGQVLRFATATSAQAAGFTLVAALDASGFKSVTGFGCNGKAAQTAAVSGGAAATTAATNVSPYGFTTAAQANSIITKLNAIQAALIANGIMS